MLPDEKAPTAIGFLKRALAFYRSHGIVVERLMTDNGSAYRSTAHALACRTLGVKHTYTRPYRPQTNGKAERYNFRRRHGALGHQPPVQRLRDLQGNNVAGIYT